MEPTNPASQSFGRYRVVQALGSGAMGSVFLAHDDLLGRDVAVKVLHTAIPLNSAMAALFKQRFANEARAVAALDHPNIVRVFDMGIEQERPYLVMEMVKGRNLAAKRADGRCPPEEVRALGIQIGRALEAAHALGILHRDIKPQNILETADGRWKLADFGVAHIPDSSLTLTGQFLGTASYAAPEALLQGAFSTASDIYSLGVTLYEAVSGQRPFGDAGAAEAAALALKQEPRPLRSLVSEVPSGLERAIVRALHRNARERPSAQELAEQLGSAENPAKLDPAPIGVASVPVALPRPSVPTEPRWGLRLWVALAALTLALIAAVVVGKQRAASREARRIATPEEAQEAALVPVKQKIDRGDLAGAVQELEQILARDPANELAREWLGRLQETLNEE